MIVLRKTMDAALETERAKVADIARRYGGALERTIALQAMFADWVTGKAEGFTPEQFADLFYAHDDRWQAAFFNALPDQITKAHDAMPEPRYANEIKPHPGVPAGEAQWWHMTRHLDDAGFETLEAMFEHAKSAREKVAA
jgi:hypothetical protein